MVNGKLIFIFLDGVGIGAADNTNPFYAAGCRFLPFAKNGCAMPDQTPIKPIDALLGVEGMPMSATGQTALFTGVNVSKILNEHKDSYPDKFMRKIIKEKNLFTHLRQMNLNPRFLNAFNGSSDLFTPNHITLFDDGEFYVSAYFKSRYTRSISVTTCMMIANRMLPFGENDIIHGRALFHDFTNQTVQNGDGRGIQLPGFSPERAAEILFNASRSYDLLLYEYFLTDFYGHGGTLEECSHLVKQLDLLVGRLLELMDPGKDTVLITSDHGNIEDISQQLHTYNPVPLLVWGNRSGELRGKIGSLVDVKPAIIDYFI